MADADTQPSLVPEVPTVARARAGNDDLFDRLWRLLSSVKFAMLLIAIAAAGVLAGTLIMQAPPDVARDANSYAGWLARPQARYGQTWATIFATLDLYRVFSSLWFRGTLAVLTLAVVVCTVNRMPGIVASVRRPAVKVPERLFERAPLRAEFYYAGISAEQAQVQAAKVLAARRYRVIPAQEGPVATVFADKNRYGKYGTFLNHIGIVTILGAAVLGNVTGWREDAFMVPEGSARPVGHDTGIIVRNEGFTDEYHPNGTPKDFYSDLVLERDGREVARKRIRVNDPLEFERVRYHQAFFGPAAVMRVTDSDGRVIFEDGVALGYQLEGDGIPRNGGFFTLNNRRLAVWVIVPAARREPDPSIPAGSVRLEIFEPRQAQPSAIQTVAQGTPTEVMGYTFEFVRERQFSGLQVAYNPAIDIIWLAAACMIAGLVLVFHFPLRRLWARAEATGTGAPGRSGGSRPDGHGEAPSVTAGSARAGAATSASSNNGGGVRLRLAAVSNRDVLFAREFETLALEIDRQIRGIPACAVAESEPGARAREMVPR